MCVCVCVYVDICAQFNAHVNTRVFIFVATNKMSITHDKFNTVETKCIIGMQVYPYRVYIHGVYAVYSIRIHSVELIYTKRHTN